MVSQLPESTGLPYIDQLLSRENVALAIYRAIRITVEAILITVKDDERTPSVSEIIDILLESCPRPDKEDISDYFYKLQRWQTVTLVNFVKLGFRLSESSNKHR